MRVALSAERKKSVPRAASSEQRKKRTTINEQPTTNFVPKLPYILQPSLRNLFGTGALATGKRPWGNAIGIDRYQ